jgi:hypothetical protein
VVSANFHSCLISGQEVCEWVWRSCDEFGCGSGGRHGVGGGVPTYSYELSK